MFDGHAFQASVQCLRIRSEFAILRDVQSVRESIRQSEGRLGCGAKDDADLVVAGEFIKRGGAGP